VTQGCTGAEDVKGTQGLRGAKDCRGVESHRAGRESVAKGLIVLRNDSLFCYFAISQNVLFCCFAKKSDAKQTKHFAKWSPFLHVLLFCDTELRLFVKNPCLVA
jgi:hypothetical protein